MCFPKSPIELPALFPPTARLRQCGARGRR